MQLAKLLLPKKLGGCFVQHAALTMLARTHRLWCACRVRPFSNIHFNATDGEVEELIEKSLDKTTYRKKDEPEVERARILTTRREALSLYRDILRYTALFVWRDDTGRVWRDVLRESARKEFEAARFENDPEIINRLLVVGRDAVHRVAEKFLSQREKVIEDEARAQERGAHPPPPPPPGHDWYSR